MSEARESLGRRIWRRRPLILYAIVILAVLGVGWSAMANRFVHRYDARLDRDPETGVIVGGEERWLGPADAPRAVLMVHGFMGAPVNFHDLPDQAAAAGWRVHAMRLPGHATSPLDMERVRADEYVTAVRDALTALQRDHETVVLVGQSMGSTISAIVAAETPPDGLILTCPYFGVTHRAHYGLRPERWFQLFSPALRWFWSEPFNPPVNRPEAREHIFSYGWTPIQAVLTAMELAETARSEAVLSRLRMPLLTIHSENDTVTCPRATRAALEKIPATRKETVWLENANHVIFWDYDREIAAEAVLDFLSAWDPPNDA